MEQSNFTTPECKTLTAEIKQEIEIRFSTPPDVLLIAMMLDPRIKRDWIDRPSANRTEALLIKEGKGIEVISSSATTEIFSILERAQKRRRLNQSAIKEDSINIEIKNYLKEATMNIHTNLEDTLDYWMKHQNIYPKLAKLAKKYLAIPATSTKVERLFSELGNIVTEKRNKMAPETLGVLGFLYNNRNKINYSLNEGMNNNENKIENLEEKGKINLTKFFT